jgi:hypothetical protein
MKETITKLVVTINQEWGANYKAEFVVTECLFNSSSWYTKVLDKDIFIATLKDALKRSGGFRMLTIDVTHGDANSLSERSMVASYRFTRDIAGEVKMSMASPQTSWHFNEWHYAVLKDVYAYAKVCVDVCNDRFVQSLRELNTQTA